LNEPLRDQTTTVALNDLARSNVVSVGRYQDAITAVALIGTLGLNVYGNVATSQSIECERKQRRANTAPTKGGSDSVSNVAAFLAEKWCQSVPNVHVGSDGDIVRGEEEEGGVRHPPADSAKVEMSTCNNKQ
jgi:ABC-type phosphate transport system substrate-binding protein